MNKQELGSCPYICGVTCAGASDKCKRCGWTKEEHKRRIATLRANGLTQNADGLWFIKIRASERKDA